MVSHPLHEGIRCEIVTQGKPLEEHETENDESKHLDCKIATLENEPTITKYIESTSGEPFKINVAVDKRYQLDSPSLLFCASIDGESVDGVVLAQLAFNIYGEEWSECIDGALVGNTLRPFLFSKITITSDDAPIEETKKLQERLSNVGEIAVKVYRQDNGGQAEFEEDTHFQEANYDADISERALKGMVGDVPHGTSLGEAMPIQGGARWLANLIDGLDKPIAIFRLKYRSKEVLDNLFMREDPAAHVIDLTETDEEEPTTNDDEATNTFPNVKHDIHDESEGLDEPQSSASTSNNPAKATAVEAWEAVVSKAVAIGVQMTRGAGQNASSQQGISTPLSLAENTQSGAAATQEPISAAEVSEPESSNTASSLSPQENEPEAPEIGEKEGALSTVISPNTDAVVNTPEETAPEGDVGKTTMGDISSGSASQNKDAPEMEALTLERSPVVPEVPAIAALPRNENFGPAIENPAVVTAEAVAENFGGASTVKVETSDGGEPGEQQTGEDQEPSTQTVKSEEVKVENLESEHGVETMEDIKEEIKTEEGVEVVPQGTKRKAQQQQRVAKKPKFLYKVTVSIDLTGDDEEEQKKKEAIVID